MKFENVDLGVGVHNYNSTATYVSGDLVYVPGVDLFYVTAEVILSNSTDISNALTSGLIVSYYDYVKSDDSRYEIKTTKSGTTTTIEGVDSSNKVQFKLVMNSSDNPSLSVTIDNVTYSFDTNKINELATSVCAKVKLLASQDISSLLTSNTRGIAEVSKLDGTDHKYITVGYVGGKLTLNGASSDVSPLSISGTDLVMDSNYIGTLTCIL